MIRLRTRRNIRAGFKVNPRETGAWKGAIAGLRKGFLTPAMMQSLAKVANEQTA
jgi:hypothetical protein